MGGERGRPRQVDTPLAVAVAQALRIRPANGDDALCLGVLATQVYLDTYAKQGIRGPIARDVLAAFSTDSCARFLADPLVRVEVAELDSHLVGFQQLQLGATHELAPPGVQAELFRLYVQEPFTGCGVGTALLRSAEALAARERADVLWLTPWVHNHRALAFYASCGYTDHGLTWYRFEGEAHENRVLAKAL